MRKSDCESWVPAPHDQQSENYDALLDRKCDQGVQEKIPRSSSSHVGRNQNGFDSPLRPAPRAINFPQPDP
jgi:hypothetical protein